MLAVGAAAFVVRRKEQNRQRVLVNRRGGGGRANRQQRQARNEHVHNNAAFDVGNNGGNAADAEEDAHAYNNDAYGNVPQSTLNQNQANSIGAGAGAGAAPTAAAQLYLAADPDQPAVYDAANNGQSNSGSAAVYATYAGSTGENAAADDDYDMPDMLPEAYSSLEAGRSMYVSSV